MPEAIPALAALIALLKVADRFLKRRATIGELRRAVKKAKAQVNWAE